VIAASVPFLVRAAEEEFDPDTVTPGIWGFVLTFVVMVVVVLLVLDMVRRIRRVNYRAEVREQLEAEQREREVQDLEGDYAAPDAPDVTPEPGSPSTGGTDDGDAAASDDEDLPPAR
jgi:flagellar biosynthesis/type III secretory pathway M-ring protein FliF/YscJ